MRAMWAVVLGFLCGCNPQPYEPHLICHNANCVEPANPEEDDTIEALVASLARVDGDGRPFVDGVEIDTFWFGDEERCLFAHDLSKPDESESPQRAVAIINAYLERRTAEGVPLTRTADTFSVFIELKGHVGLSEAERHDAAQRASHAACAVAAGESLVERASIADYPIEIVYTSFEPQLLVAVRDHPALGDVREAATVKLGILQGIPRPLDGQTQPLDAFPADLDVDVIDVHPQWTKWPERHAYGTRDAELAYWMFSIVPETLDAVRAHRPAYITTSEARAMAVWLERTFP